MTRAGKPEVPIEFKNLTPETKIPLLGLGTWGMGGKQETETTYDEESIIAIKTAIELGMTHIDTAEMYGRGHTEDLVGQAIREFNREDLFITTKVLAEHLRYNDVVSSARDSLRRLGTEYIDLYLIHSPSPGIPIQETMKAFDFLVEKGLIKHMGVSNFSVEEMKEAQGWSQNKIVANQIEYNLLVRNRGMLSTDMESEIIPYCQQNDMLVIAWCPLARGRLLKPGFKILDKLAQKYTRTRAQVALNWLISKNGIIAIPKASNVKHLEENMGAIGWELEQEDIQTLDNAFGDAGS